MISNNWDFLESVIKNAKILYIEFDSYLQTLWKDSDLAEFAILLTIEQDWVNFLILIDVNKLPDKTPEEISKELLHLNLRYLGPKFAMDKKDRFVLVNQVPLETLTASIYSHYFSNSAIYYK